MSRMLFIGRDLEVLAHIQAAATRRGQPSNLRIEQYAQVSDGAAAMAREERNGGAYEMVVIDLNGEANAAEPLAQLRQVEGYEERIIAGLANTIANPERSRLIEAGADALFQVTGTAERIRAEMDSLLDYFERNRPVAAT